MPVQFRERGARDVRPDLQGERAAEVGKGDEVFAASRREGACGDRRPPGDAVVTQVELPIANSAVLAVLTGQVAEAADGFFGAQVDHEMVRVGRIGACPLRVPEGIRIAVDGESGGRVFPRGFLTVRGDLPVAAVDGAAVGAGEEKFGGARPGVRVVLGGARHEFNIAMGATGLDDVIGIG